MICCFQKKKKKRFLNDPSGIIIEFCALFIHLWSSCFHHCCHMPSLSLQVVLNYAPCRPTHLMIPLLVKRGGATFIQTVRAQQINVHIIVYKPSWHFLCTTRVPKNKYVYSSISSIEVSDWKQLRIYSAHTHIDTNMLYGTFLLTSSLCYSKKITAFSLGALSIFDANTFVLIPK